MEAFSSTAITGQINMQELYKYANVMSSGNRRTPENVLSDMHCLERLTQRHLD